MSEKIVPNAPPLWAEFEQPNNPGESQPTGVPPQAVDVTVYRTRDGQWAARLTGCSPTLAGPEDTLLALMCRVSRQLAEHMGAE